MSKKKGGVQKLRKRITNYKRHPLKKKKKKTYKNLSRAVTHYSTIYVHIK